MKRLNLLAIFLFGSLTMVSAQKVGHVNIEKIITEMPSYIKYMDSMKVVTKKEQGQLIKMQKNYQRLAKIYQDSSATWSDALKQIKLKELNDAKTNMEYFSAYRGRELDSLQGLFVNDLIEKVKDATQIVAKQKGMTYVLNYSEQTQLVLYYEETHDLTADVKKQLGLL